MSKTLSGNARAAIVAAALLLPLTLAGNSFAEDPAAITITLKDDAFSPAEVKVPAGKAFTLKFANKDAAAAEIEAKDLKIEQVVAGAAEIAVTVRAQQPGRYLFVNEYKEDVVKGFVVVE